MLNLSKTHQSGETSGSQSPIVNKIGDGDVTINYVTEIPTFPVRPNTLPYASLGTLFKGRDEFLRDLRAGLDGGVIGIQALHGLGGIGKTRAAIEYAHAHADDYTALLFVNAETPEALTTGLANLVGPMLLTQYATVDTDTQVEAALA